MKYEDIDKKLRDLGFNQYDLNRMSKNQKKSALFNSKRGA